MKTYLAALILSLTFVMLCKASAETSFIYGNNDKSATVIQPSPTGPAFYYGNDATTGTIQRPPPNGPTFYNFTSPEGRRQSGTITTPPSYQAIPGMQQPMQPMQPYGLRQYGR